MITDYKSRKNEVLESYENVEKLIAALKENAQRAGMSNPLERLESLLTDIRNKAEKVRADRFSLMIAGESKSGKSTFINAYLGVELLPMDVKQCTSAIIEIKNGEKFCVRATYADGRKEEIKGDSAAKEFLQKNAALDDEYRDIPVPTINSEILVKSGLKSKAKGAEISISKREVEDLLNAPEVQEANIHNIPTEEYNKRIQDYIYQKKSSWQSIVTTIEVFFSFGEEMRGIEIIDSPGVCAHGGVAEITSKYIESADAIIFLKPVSGQALESTQFNRFMQNASVARNKNSLFLVLTRATNVTSADLRRLEDEAYQQFNNLDKRNILLVDSKAELYAKNLSAIDDIKTELRRLNEAGTLDDFVVKAYSDASGLFGNGGNGDFIKALHEKSRFEQIYNSLEVFGRRAHYILLGSLLDSICNLYKKLWSDLNLQMDMFRQKAEDPIVLAKKIAEIKQELDDINNKMYKGVDAAVRRFLGDEGIIRTTADNAVKDFISEISNINSGSYGSFDELEKCSILKMDDFSKLSEKLQREIITECDRKLIALSDKSAISFESLKPNFTEATFAEIRKSTESKAHKKYNETTGWGTFKETHSRSKYAQNQHVDLIKKSILGRIEVIKNDLIDNLGEFANKIQTQYINELSNNAEAKKNEFDTIMEAKDNAEQIKAILKDLAVSMESIASAKSYAEKIQGGIAKNVQ
jgi:GTPase SAR1 family protein